jgi:hypothetical protein
VLTRENITYECDFDEFPLWSPGDDRQFGQTRMAARLTRIYGEENYIVLYDFMSPTGVFRKSDKPQFDLRRAGATEMELTPLMSGPSGGHSSSDPVLVRDAIAKIFETTPAIPVSTLRNPDKFGLYFSGGKLTGMKYCAGIFKDGKGAFYIAHDTQSTMCRLATPAFATWATR